MYNFVGGIEVICGPMFSGKTLELFRRIHLARLARQKVQIFRSSREDDKNYSQLLSVVCPGVEIFYAEDSYHLLTNFIIALRLWVSMKFNFLVTPLLRR